MLIAIVLFAIGFSIGVAWVITKERTIRFRVTKRSNEYRAGEFLYYPEIKDALDRRWRITYFEELPSGVACERWFHSRAEANDWIARAASYRAPKIDVALRSMMIACGVYLVFALVMIVFGIAPDDFIK